jgi:hypothetical protein
MSVNWNSATKSARMQAGLNSIDKDINPAVLEIGSTGMTSVLVKFTLQKPSFTEANGVLTCIGLPLSSIGTLTGNAAAARVKDGAGTIVIDGLTAGLSNADVILNDVSIVTNQGATLQTFIITHA